MDFVECGGEVRGVDFERLVRDPVIGGCICKAFGLGLEGRGLEEEVPGCDLGGYWVVG